MTINNRIYNQDCLDGMKEIIPNSSIHLVFTSPPYYNARDYSQFSFYGDYLHFMHRVIREVQRVLKKGRFFVLNTSPVIEAREKRQDQSTRYPIPFDIHQYVMNSGFSFIDDIVWIKPEPSVVNRNAGFYRHRKPLAYKPNSVTEYLMVYRKKSDKLIDWELNQYEAHIVEESLVRGEYERSNAWIINPESSDVHPAVFPEELASKVIQYYSIKGDLVLDPFMGSGTTAVSCKKLGRKFVGFEQCGEYYEMAIRRVNNCKVFKTMDSFFSE